MSPFTALCSTIAVVRQLVSERVSIKITVSRDIVIHGNPRYDGMTLIVLKTINRGRRPVTIVHTGAFGLHPAQPFICTDNQPPLAHEIKEGEYITSVLDQSDTDITTIDYWQAIDSTGRVSKLREASRLKHWKSILQRKPAPTSQHHHHQQQEWRHIKKMQAACLFNTR